MKTYEHGGNIWSFQPPRDVIDLSTCVADSMPAELAPILSDLWLYTTLPEPYSAQFSLLFQEKYKIKGDVLLTSGTTEAIYTICRLFEGETASILIPTYMDYEHAAKMNRMQINYTPNIKEMPVSALNFICTPNNPTGQLQPQSDIYDLARKNPRAYFVIDESYMPFVEDRNGYSTVDSMPNIITLRSYSKVFGIPGLRTGYVTAHRDIIDRLKNLISPWSVGTAAQQVAIKLLERDESPAEGLQLEERKLFRDALASLPAELLPGDVHFNLCKLQNTTALDFTSQAAEKNILIRDCSNIRGLEGGQYVRISMRKGWEALFT